MNHPLTDWLGDHVWRRAGATLAAGALLTLLLTAPMIRYIGWVLSAVIHEGGHWLGALSLGIFALPAVSLKGHSATILSSGANPGVALLVWIGLMLLGWKLWVYCGVMVRVAVAAVCLLFPVAAFWEWGQETFMLMNGHLAEWLVGAIFIWRAATGIAVHGAADRVASAMVGWYLLGRNLLLFANLIVSSDARYRYTFNGSYDLENDLTLLARHWNTTLPATATACFVFAAATLAIALIMAFFELRRHHQPVRVEPVTAGPNSH